jgi:hypothetical protein
MAHEKKGYKGYIRSAPVGSLWIFIKRYGEKGSEPTTRSREEEKEDQERASGRCKNRAA